MHHDSTGPEPVGSAKLASVLALIDKANAADPNSIAVDADRKPAAFVYGQRMSDMLAKFHPHASEALRIAARAQHIERWTLPRTDYPEGRAGYHRWRNEQKLRHARAAGDIMAEVGYPADAIGRVQSLLRKEDLKRDAESQALEDVACLVFLQYYLADFAASQDEEKLSGIIAKTWVKMSPDGQAAAGKLSLGDKAQALVQQALSGR